MRCDAELVRAVKQAGQEQHEMIYVPLRPYPYYSVKAWLNRMIRRPHIEKLLVKSWNDSSPLAPGSPWTDILQAPALQQFCDSDGNLFSQPPEFSIHIAFGLYIDWFNPEGNKQAGKVQSVGAIYLVCLNLPAQMRFRPENICLVGIIPGPSEPSLHQINHFLRPLVTELLELWQPGVTLQPTGTCSHTRTIRAAIIPLICDLPALRKTAGYAGHSSRNFCSFCLLRKSDINNLSRPWPTRSRERHMVLALQWRDAQTEAERKALFDRHGIRWSELLRLPYWDPTRYATVDAMHNLFLGEVRHHIRQVWGLGNRPEQSITPRAVAHTPEDQGRYLQELVEALQRSSQHETETSALSAILKLRKGYLITVAQLNNVPIRGAKRKRDYAESLVEWVCFFATDRFLFDICTQAKSHAIDDLQIPPVLGESAAEFHLADTSMKSAYCILTREVIGEIREDIGKTYLPSWLEHPPLNFGSASHGKLKADHWRTVCTVSLVITLTRVWTSASATDKEKRLLDNFLHLVIAVDLASRRSMDTERANLFDSHMLHYLRTLRELFDHTLVPNHHLSLHLSTCLLNFGPVHGWWAYPFERYNGIIQRFNTNHKIGEI